MAVLEEDAMISANASVEEDDFEQVVDHAEFLTAFVYCKLDRPSSSHLVCGTRTPRRLKRAIPILDGEKYHCWTRQ